MHLIRATENHQALLHPMIRDFMREEGIEVDDAALTCNLAAMISHAGARVWIAEEDSGQVAGFITATFSVGLEFGRSAEIEDLYVLPAWRGRGLARRMMDLAMDRCRDEGVSEVVLYVTPDGQDQGLPEFYRKLGFHQVDRMMFQRGLDNRQL